MFDGRWSMIDRNRFGHQPSNIGHRLLLMLNFSHEVFLEVAKQLSFSKAAEILFVSQPSISRHIKSLEENYHISLFERKGNSILLTEEGKLLFDYLERAKELQRQLEFDITTFTNTQAAKGSLVIGASTTVSLYV